MVSVLGSHHDPERSFGIRLTAAPCPVTHQSQSPTWLSRRSSRRVWLKDVQLYVFCNTYRQENMRQNKSGAFEICFHKEEGTSTTSLPHPSWAITFPDPCWTQGQGDSKSCLPLGWLHSIRGASPSPTRRHNVSSSPPSCPRLSAEELHRGLETTIEANLDTQSWDPIPALCNLLFVR